MKIFTKKLDANGRLNLGRGIPEKFFGKYVYICWWKNNKSLILKLHEQLKHDEPFLCKRKVDTKGRIFLKEIDEHIVTVEFTLDDGIIIKIIT